jgi:hypothetical protein
MQCMKGFVSRRPAMRKDVSLPKHMRAKLDETQVWGSEGWAGSADVGKEDRSDMALAMLKLVLEDNHWW